MERGLQGCMSTVLHALSQRSLMKNKVDAARITSLSQFGGMLVFSVIPSEEALMIPNAAFAFKVACALGCPAITRISSSQAALCPSKKCKSSDPTQHIFNCGYCGGDRCRHNMVLYTLAAAGRAAKCVVIVEPRCTLREAGSSGPDAEFMNFPSHGHNSLVEVAITNPVKKATTAGGAVEPLREASYREKSKRSKYQLIADINDRHNLQAVFECTGAFGNGALALLNTLAGLASTGDYQPPETSTWATDTYFKYWSQRLAVSLCLGQYQHSLKSGGGLSPDGPAFRRRPGASSRPTDRQQ
jgi:hypothetical protein